VVALKKDMAAARDLLKKAHEKNPDC